MKQSNPNWSSPYKTKLWLFSQNSDTFCKKELELWDYIAARGKNGCDAWNWRIAEDLHRSVRQIRRYLRNLEDQALIIRIPGWTELTGSQPVKVQRNRLLIALPWPNRRAWQAAYFRQNSLQWADKNVRLQKSSNKITINPERISELGKAERTPEQRITEYGLRRGSGGNGKQKTSPRSRVVEILRQQLIEQLINVGHSRARAIRLADVKIQKGV